jgi:hypothetical protein
VVRHEQEVNFVCLCCCVVLLVACGPKVPPDRRFARDVAASVNDADERCSESGADDATLQRCAKLRNDLKPLLIEADRDHDAGAP